MQLLKQYCAREGVMQCVAFRRAKAKQLQRPLSFEERLEVDQESLAFGRADPPPTYLVDFLTTWRRSIFVSQV